MKETGKELGRNCGVTGKYYGIEQEGDINKIGIRTEKELWKKLVMN